MRERYLFYGEVIAQTALHIGSGRGDLRTDATVVKELRAGSEQPFIPGSSFKGALRGAVETLAAGLPNVRTCQLTEGQADCLSVRTDWQEKFREAQEQQASENVLDKMMLPEGCYPLCHTCLLFGSPFRASKVLVRDMRLKTGFVSEIRHGVGIDRDTATAREGVKFDYEVVPSQNRFDFELVLESPKGFDLPLVAAGLREMQLEQVALGGNSSRGVGRIQLHLLRIVQLDLSGKALIDYLRNSRPGASDQSVVLQGVREWTEKKVEKNNQEKSEIDWFLDEQIEKLLPGGK